MQIIQNKILEQTEGEAGMTNAQLNAFLELKIDNFQTPGRLILKIFATLLFS